MTEPWIYTVSKLTAMTERAERAERELAEAKSRIAQLETACELKDAVIARMEAKSQEEVK